MSLCVCFAMVWHIALARRLDHVARPPANGPLAMPKKGLHIEWSSPEPCWSTTDSVPTWNECRDWIARLFNWTDTSRASVIQIYKKDRITHGPLFVINFEDLKHNTSLADLDKIVRNELGAEINKTKKGKNATMIDKNIEGYAGTKTKNWASYVRRTQDTCRTSGAWGHFSLWMKMWYNSPGIPVHVQCWLEMYETSDSWDKCSKKVDLVVQLPQSVILQRWDIPIQMTEYGTYYDFSCTFSKINDGNQFATVSSNLTEICTAGYPGASRAYTYCYGTGGGPEENFEGRIHYKTWDEPNTFVVTPL